MTSFEPWPRARSKRPRERPRRWPSATSAVARDARPTAFAATRPPRWCPITSTSSPKRSASPTVCAKSRAVTSTSAPLRAQRLDDRPHDEDVRAVGQVDPDAHGARRRRHSPGRVVATLGRLVLAFLLPLGFAHGPAGPLRDERRRRPRAGGGLRAHAPRERVHPDPERGDDAVRRLQRLRGPLQPDRGDARRHVREPRRLVDRLRASATTAASTSSRSTAASCTSSPRTSHGPTAGSSATATRRSSSPGCCRSSARSSRCPPASRGCRSGASARSPLAGCLPWVFLLAFIGRRSGRTGRTGRTACTTSTTRSSRLIVLGVVLPRRAQPARPQAPARGRGGCARRLTRSPGPKLSHALALGALHGPAELLPVSSSAHTTLVPWLLGWSYPDLDPELRKAFEVALHAGTAAALLVGLRDEVADAARGLRPPPDLTLVVGSFVPPAIVGYTLERPIERRLGTPPTIAAGLAAGAAAMWIADARSPQRRGADGGAASPTPSRSASRRRARSCPASRATGRRSPPPAPAASGGRTRTRCRATSRCRSSSARPCSRASGWRAAACPAAWRARSRPGSARRSSRRSRRCG